MEDLSRVRKELEHLKKEILASKHIKEVLDSRIQDLHKEEVRYLDEIPSLKREWQKHNIILRELREKCKDVDQSWSSAKEELKILRKSIDSEQLKLSDLIKKNELALTILDKKEEELKVDASKLRDREDSVRSREIKCDSRELACIDREEIVFKGEVELNIIREDINKLYKKLESDIEIHKSRMLNHEKREAVLLENKKYHVSQEEILKQKMQQAEKIIKDNAILKNQLMLQAEKLSKEIRLANEKQTSLDRNISDLTNQSNALKIKELKVKKMAHDAGLIKELKELEESIK